jgi:hypothetical protein
VILSLSTNWKVLSQFVDTDNIALGDQRNNVQIIGKQTYIFILLCTIKQFG